MKIIINADSQYFEQENSSENPNIQQHATGGNFYEHLLISAGYSKESPPVGDLLRHYHQLEGQWMVASPIYWEATHNDALIMACGSQLNLSSEQAHDWFHAFSEFIAADNLSAYFIDKYTWLLRYDDKPPIQSKPVHQVLHRSMMPSLHALDETMYWQRFITENQMFFSNHSLNEQRAKMPINGIWLWGAGRLHAPGNQLILCENQSLIDLTSLISTNAQLYQPDRKPAKKSVLVLDKLDESEHKKLQQQLKNKNVQWFWNDAVYHYKPKPWFSRIWR